MRVTASDAAVAVEAALAATVLEAVGRFAWSGPYVPELMAQKLFALLPPWAFTPLLRVFGYNAKYHAFAGMIAVEVGSLTLVGAVLRGWMRGRRLVPRIVVAVATGALALLVVAVLLPLLDAGVCGQALPGGPWVVVPTFVVVMGCYAAVLTRRTT